MSLGSLFRPSVFAPGDPDRDIAAADRVQRGLQAKADRDQRAAELQSRQISDIFDRVDKFVSERNRNATLLERERVRATQDDLRRGAQDRRSAATIQAQEARRAATRRDIRSEAEAGRQARRNAEIEDAQRKVQDAQEQQVIKLSNATLEYPKAQQIAQASGLPVLEVASRYGRGERYELSPADSKARERILQDAQAVKADEDYSLEDREQAAFQHLQTANSLRPQWQEPEFDGNKHFDKWSTVLPTGQIVIWKPDPKNRGDKIIDKILEPPDDGIGDEEKLRFRARESATRAIMGDALNAMKFADPETGRVNPALIDTMAENMLNFATKKQDGGDAGVLTTEEKEAKSEALKTKQEIIDRAQGDPSKMTPEDKETLRRLREQGLL